MALAAGTRLGPYEIVSALGAGGMGEVYRARDPRLQRDVAIKVLPAAVADDPERLRRLQQEARAIAALNHPNICQVYDVGPNYLVLEYIDGAPLKGPLEDDRVLTLALQIADALDAAHRRGILHRDLKPANILVSGSTAKMLDFGLAKWLDTDTTSQTTEPGAIVGTLAYMSPEQANAQPADARSDIFSLGAVLHEVLSGRRAFAGETNLDVVNAVLRHDPPPLPGSYAMSAIIKRCLEKSPSARFQTAAELKAALEQMTRRSPASKEPSIAVLPFADMSPARDHEWFSDGLSEEILNALTRLKGLKVIARTSAFAFKGKQDDIRKIAAALDVTTVLDGSVRRAGSRLRVAAQLIRAGDGSHLWSERYDRDMDDVFAIQDDIARAIASALEVTLLAKPATSRHVPDMVAYEDYLKGRQMLFKVTHSSLRRARELLQHTVELDPEFALGHCAVGICALRFASVNLIKTDEAVAVLKSSAQHALAVEPDLSDAHALLALADAANYDWSVAGRRFQSALSSGPVSSDFKYWYAMTYLAPLGKIHEAIRAMKDALRSDPLNLFIQNAIAMFLFAIGDEEQASAEMKRLIALDDEFFVAHLWLGTLSLRRGRTVEMLEHAERAHAVAPDPFNIGFLAGALDVNGDTTRANALRENLGGGEAFGAPAGLYAYHAVRNEVAEAARWLEEAIRQRDWRSAWILPNVFGTLIISSSHWPRLAALMNLTAAPR